MSTLEAKAGFPEGFPPLDEPVDGLGSFWPAMQALPQEAIRYFQVRFRMQGKHEYDPAFDQQGLTPAPGQPSKIGWPSLAGWDSLVMNLWHEEAHQFQPMWSALPVLDAYWERDAWDHALAKAREHGIPEVYLRHWQFVRDDWRRQEPWSALERWVERLRKLLTSWLPFR